MLQFQPGFAADNASSDNLAPLTAASDNGSVSQLDSISQLENRYFEHDFHSDSLSDRLLRLEQLLFGEGKGGSFDERLSLIEKTASKPSGAAASASTSLLELEQHLYQHDFSAESTEERLARLEQMAFGASKNGSDNDRVKALCTALGGNWLSSNKSQAQEPQVTSTSTRPSHKAKVLEHRETVASLLSEGMADFKAQRYHHAQEQFEKAIAISPRSPEAYANLGGTLIMLQDKPGALEAFKACFALQPFGKIGAYAKEQILKVVKDTAYEKTDPQDGQKIVESTIKTINRQTADRSRIYQTQSRNIANYRIDLANTEINKLSNETQQALADLHAQNYYGGGFRYSRYGGGGGRVDPYASREISNMSYIRTNYLRSDGQVSANLAITDGLTRSRLAFESGSNLKDQLLQPVQPGGAKLRALGTSLYARYYGDGTPSSDDPPAIDPPPAALSASAKSISQNGQK